MSDLRPIGHLDAETKTIRLSLPYASLPQPQAESYLAWLCSKLDGCVILDPDGSLVEPWEADRYEPREEYLHRSDTV